MNNFRNYDSLPFLSSAPKSTSQRVVYGVYGLAFLVFISAIFSYIYIDDLKTQETIVSAVKMDGYSCPSVGSVSYAEKLMARPTYLMASPTASGRRLIGSDPSCCRLYDPVNGAQELSYESATYADSNACVSEVVSTLNCSFTFDTFHNKHDIYCNLTNRGDVKIINELYGECTCNATTINDLMKEYFPASEICARFDNLPPFVCTRSYRLSFVSIFSSAAALASAVVSVLIPSFVEYFEYLSKRPKSNTKNVELQDKELQDKKEKEEETKTPKTILKTQIPKRFSGSMGVFFEGQNNKSRADLIGDLEIESNI